MRRLRAGLAVVLWLEALTWGLSAYLHTGHHLSFLPTVFQDASIRGAPEVEGVGGFLLAVAAILVTAKLPGRWLASLVANATAVVFDCAGMVLIAVGAGPDSTFNFWFHRIGVAVAFLLCVFLIATRRGFSAAAPAEVTGGHPGAGARSSSR